MQQCSAIASFQSTAFSMYLDCAARIYQDSLYLNRVHLCKSQNTMAKVNQRATRTPQQA
jgi:hypothetical protein